MVNVDGSLLFVMKLKEINCASHSKLYCTWMNLLLRDIWYLRQLKLLDWNCLCPCSLYYFDTVRCKGQTVASNYSVILGIILLTLNSVHVLFCFKSRYLYQNDKCFLVSSCFWYSYLNGFSTSRFIKFFLQMFHKPKWVMDLKSTFIILKEFCFRSVA